jgi:hypothetical protein
VVWGDYLCESAAEPCAVAAVLAGDVDARWPVAGASGNFLSGVESLRPFPQVTSGHRVKAAAQPAGYKLGTAAAEPRASAGDTGVVHRRCACGGLYHHAS